MPTKEMKRATDMGIRNGKNYLFILVALMIGVGATFGVQYIGKVTTEGPVNDATLQGQINVLTSEINNLKMNQEQFRKSVDQDFKEVKEALARIERKR